VERLRGTCIKESLQTSFVSRFCITFSVWSGFPIENVRFIKGDDFNLFDSISSRSLKERVYELNIPGFCLRDPEVINFCWVNEVGILDDEIIINIFPRAAPGSTPNRNVSLRDLIGRILIAEVQ
jgi:hypothetical protein